VTTPARPKAPVLAPSRPTRTVPASRRVALLVVLIATALFAAACSSSGGGGTGTSDVSASPSPAGPKLTVTPAANATGVSPVTPISLSVDKNTITAVSVTANDGDAVEGTIGADKKTWASKGKLSFGATYSVKVTTDASTTPLTSSFQTVPTPSADSSVRASSIEGDGKTYGVGMPIILKLSHGVKSQAAKAAFEKTLSVTSSPSTTGAWGWISSTELHFRPSSYWAAGSTVHVAVNSAGIDLGSGLWGRTDLTVDFKIGIKRIMYADAQTHYMKVVENGATVRTIPVSLGSAAHPSSSGTLLIIDKRPTAIFDSSTYGLPADAPGGYRTAVKYAMRLTWDGQFIHDAPWSVAQQGSSNVSHGCINVGPANIPWLFDRAQVGDPVVVTNTGTQIPLGDGYSDWSISFASWLTHSANGQITT
jgi:lipoprotein-anchoring transpeptidase ErfK/SrfK